MIDYNIESFAINNYRSMTYSYFEISQPVTLLPLKSLFHKALNVTKYISIQIYQNAKFKCDFIETHHAYFQFELLYYNRIHRLNYDDKQKRKYL